ncbi:syntaxin-like protein [Collybia nuda]|uniref:Syntaxin-like protein n=1 Tax=Collybia nuda TaxID=64659 RepID=A0A9P6CD69_9AGAR|nr:syntaxin-like protein [Collybia nuda]
MSTLRPQPLGGNVHDPEGNLSFLAEITSIQDCIEQLRINVNEISILHTHTLNALEQGAEQDENQLDRLAKETQSLGRDLKGRIKALETSSIGHDVQMRKNRIALVRSKFLEVIQGYQQVEQEYRAKSKQRVERQFKIVKPDATPEEIATVVSGGGQQIFFQALSSSSRYGESRIAFREVQQRQQDIVKLEQTLAELAQLFDDMGTLVNQQEETINMVETTAQDVEANTEKAVDHTKKAIVHARSYRRGRWICFFIFLLIAVVLAIVLGVVFGRK